MSDMRAIIAIGVSITSLVMVFGIFSLIPNDYSTMSTDRIPMSVFGHMELTVIDPDGFIKAYIQTDNKSMDNVKECMMNNAFAGNNIGNVLCGEVDQMAIGDGVANDDDGQNTLDREFINTGRSVIGTNGTLVLTHPAGDNSIVKAIFDADDTKTAPSASFVIAVADTTGNQGTCNTDNDSDGLAECQIQEVGLFDSGNNKMLFRSVFTAADVEAGDKVQMRYTVTLQ